MKNFLKNNKGFTASDALIAVLIIALFAGVISTLLYNIYIANTSLKRLSKANLIFVDTFEYIDSLDYDGLTIEKLNEKYTELIDITQENPGTPEESSMQRLGRLKSPENEKEYKIDIVLDRYNPEPEGTAQDLIKKVTMTVKYKIGNRNQEITMSRIKTK